MQIQSSSMIAASQRALHDAAKAFVFLSSFRGTGGELSTIPSKADLMAGSGAAVVIGERAIERREARLSERLANIKSAFGLSLTELACVLQVQRPTVYAWLSDARGVHLRSANKRRIDDLYELAKAWNEVSNLPASHFFDEVKLRGRDLLWHLSQPEISLSAVQDLVADMAQRSIALRSDNIAKPSAIERLRGRGFAEAPRRTRRPST